MAGATYVPIRDEAGLFNSNRLYGWDDAKLQLLKAAGKRYYSDVVAVMIMIDRAHQYYGLDPIEKKYLYDKYKESRIEEGYVPDAAEENVRLEYDDFDLMMNHLSGHRADVIDQYREIAENLVREDDNDEPEGFGLLPLLAGNIGISGLIDGSPMNTHAIERVMGNRMDPDKFGGLNVPISRQALGGDLINIEEFSLIDFINAIRLKYTVLTLHDDKVRVWDLFGAMFGTDENNIDVDSPENLLCECLIYDEILDPLTGATAITGYSAGNFNSNFPADIYIALGDKIRRYEEHMLPIAHSGSTYEAGGGGTGDITSIVVFSSWVYYIQGGLVRRFTKSSGGSDTAITIRREAWGLPGFVFTMTDFDDLVVAHTGTGGANLMVRRGNRLFHLTTSTSQIVREAIDIEEDYEKFFGTSYANQPGLMVPFKQYDITLDPVEYWNDKYLGFNFVGVKGDKELELHSHHQIEKGLFDASHYRWNRAINSGVGVPIYTSGVGGSAVLFHYQFDPGDASTTTVERRCFVRVAKEGFHEAVELELKMFLSLYHGFFNQFDGTRVPVAGIGIQIREYTNPSSWPPGGNDTDFFSTSSPIFTTTTSGGDAGPSNPLDSAVTDIFDDIVQNFTLVGDYYYLAITMSNQGLLTVNTQHDEFVTIQSTENPLNLLCSIGGTRKPV